MQAFSDPDVELYNKKHIELTSAALVTECREISSKRIFLLNKRARKKQATIRLDSILIGF